MKLILAIAILTAGVLGQSVDELQAKIKGFQESKKYTVAYDKFKDETAVTFFADILWKNNELIKQSRLTSMYWSFHAVYAGNGVKGKPARQHFCIETTSREWRFLKNSGLIFIIDGQKIDAGEGDHEGEILRGGVSEQVCWRSDSGLYATIINGKAIEFQYGPVEGSVRPEKIPMFEQYRSLVAP